MKQELDGKVAIVTGAGHGLGAMTARALAGVGAKVAVNDINPDRAEKVAQGIRAQGGEALGIAADVANKFQCVHLIETTRQAWGRLDILVNCAAVQPVEPILGMDEWAWQRCMDVNLKGTFFMTQLVARVMADENGARGGSIIQIGAPVGTETAVPHRAAYAAGKAGVVSFGLACAHEFAPFAIRVNSLLPGMSNSVADAGLSDQPVPEWLAEIVPAEVGPAEQAVAAILYLCSESGSAISGRAIALEGSR